MAVRSVKKKFRKPRKVFHGSMRETRAGPNVTGLPSECGQVTDVIGDFSDLRRSSTCCTLYRTES